MKPVNKTTVIKLCVSLPRAVVRFAKSKGKVSPAIAAAVLESKSFKKWERENE